MVSNYNYDRHEKCPEKCTDECHSLGYQYADIIVPFEMTPDVKIGEIETECCDGARIYCKRRECGSSEFVLTQKVRLKIPVKCSVCAEAKDGKIVCEKDKCHDD